ncbi:MAG: hypothetical protein JWM84_3749 [Nocardioides sp.]|nr:hypothetical protein [Nocardioides sp.]
MPIERSFPLTDASEAHAFAERARPFGRVLLDMEGTALIDDGRIADHFTSVGPVSIRPVFGSARPSPMTRGNSHDCPQSGVSPTLA